jgi:hypothetical protein
VTGRPRRESNVLFVKYETERSHTDINIGVLVADRRRLSTEDHARDAIAGIVTGQAERRNHVTTTEDSKEELWQLQKWE